MNKATEYMYYMKMVYLNAGKALIKENNSNYKNLVNKQKVKSICKNINNKNASFYLSFRDYAGCAVNRVFSNIIDSYKSKSDIFIINDCYGCDNSIKGVYMPNTDILLFCDNEYKFKNVDIINLHRCYYRQDIGRYSSRKLYSMADSYFEKSKYIAKDKCL